MAKVGVQGKTIAEVREELAKAGAHPLVDQVVREIGSHLPHVDGKKGDQLDHKDGKPVLREEDDNRAISVAASWSDQGNSEIVKFDVSVEIVATKGKR
jgi:hypothetical protein